MFRRYPSPDHINRIAPYLKLPSIWGKALTVETTEDKPCCWDPGTCGTADPWHASAHGCWASVWNGRDSRGQSVPPCDPTSEHSNSSAGSPAHPNTKRALVKAIVRELRKQWMSPVLVMKKMDADDAHARPAEYLDLKSHTFEWLVNRWGACTCWKSRFQSNENDFIFSRIHLFLSLVNWTLHTIFNKLETNKMKKQILHNWKRKEVGRTWSVSFMMTHPMTACFHN